MSIGQQKSNVVEWKWFFIYNAGPTTPSFAVILIKKKTKKRKKWTMLGGADEDTTKCVVAAKEAHLLMVNANYGLSPPAPAAE